MIVGVSGVAGAGKDLFVQSCINELEQRDKKAGSLAIASSLKNEVRNWCLEHYDVDSLGDDREKKEKIREFLVFHGSLKRKASNGRHWIKLADDVVKSIEGNRIYDYLFISDVRYNDYPEDEVYWIKEELKGALVHISQYEVKEVTSKKEWPKTEEGRVFREPANKEEARNDPKVKESADYRLEWEYIHKNHPNFINKDKYLNNKIVSFIEWLDTR